MPKNKVADPITNQEIAFARLILAGKMSDQQAAEAAGLNPTTAAYTKAKPRVQEWMKEHRAVTEKQLLEQEAEDARRKTATRERVLARLWAIADLTADETRNSMASQVKALAMIAAIEDLIPDRRAGSKQKTNSPVVPPNVYRAEWLRNSNSASESTAGLDLQQDQEHESVVSPLQSTAEAPPPSPEPAPTFDPGDPDARSTMTFAEENSSPYTSFVPDTRGPFQLPRRPFGRWRR